MINTRKKTEQRSLMYSIIGTAALIGLCSIFLPGCGKNERDGNDGSLSTSAEEEIDYQSLAEQMEEGKYYVLHNGSVTEITTVEETASGTGTIAWMDHDSYDDIATLYKGDKLIYYTTETIEESFAYTRYMDMGYTIPICKLTEGDSGKYHTEAGSDAESAYPDSSLEGTLASFTTDEVILDKIGGTSLTSENVSEYGTVTGLTQDEEYNMDIYSGSVLTKTSAYANIRVMAQNEDQNYTTSRFDFLSGEVIQIGIPNWFNSGYYEINGEGYFRYVNGSFYDETTNFNVLNTMPEGDASEDVSLDVTNLSDTFEIKEAGTYLITVTLSYPSDMERAAEGTGGVITAPDGEHYTMYNNGSGQLIFQKNDMKVGTYTIGYTDANGLKPEITVEKVTANQ